MKPIRVLSLFDGIAVARLALSVVNRPVSAYYASEVDEAAMKIASGNWPDIIQLGSITTLDERNLPTDIDLLIGGSPCQDLSSANANGLGLEGEKSKLFWHFIRILQIIKPRYFVLENVASMAHSHRDLMSVAVGVKPVYINARSFGAQNRARYYWTNIRLPDLPPPPSKHTIVGSIAVSHEIAAVQNAYPIECPYLQNWWMRKRVNPLVVNIAGRRRFSCQHSMARIHDACGKASTIRTGGSGYYVFPDGIVRPLCILEVERLQGFPDGYTAVGNCCATRRMHAIGNAFEVQSVVWILSYMQ